MTASRAQTRALVRIRRILLLAAAYVAAGRVALLLALPPAYAAPVWPSAGIALAGVLFWGRWAWPGVLLGSCAIHVWLFFDASTPAPTLHSATIALALGAGAALQALVAAALVRRRVGWPNSMVRAKDIGLLLLLGGPVGCLLNAVWSPAVLLLNGLITWADLPFAVFTWWAGDTIGVLFVVPLVVIWGTREESTIRRRLFMSLPPALALGMAGALFFVVTGLERQRIQFEFRRGGDRIHEAVKDGIGAHVETLRSLRSLYYASEEVTPDEIRAFVAPALDRDDAIRAFSWIEHVLEGERDAFEEAVRRTAGPDFRITQWGPDRTLVPASRRPEYLVVRHLEPPEGNERALGHDVLSDPSRTRALREAASSGEAVATRLVTLVQAPNRPPSIVVYLAVYEGGRLPDPGNRWNDTRGFVAAALDVPRLLSEALARAGPLGIDAALFDREPSEEPRLLATSASLAAYEGDESARPLESTLDLPVAHALWSLRFVSGPGYVEDRWGWAPWVALASGLLLTGLVGAFLLVATGRALLVEELVRQRTEALRLAQRDLVRRNEEIRSVYHTVSHELKTPLASTREFVAIVHDGIAGPVTASQTEYLAYARDGIDQVARLVDDLTDVARLETGKLTLELAPTAVERVLVRVVASLRTAALEKGLLVVLGTDPDCPEARADEGRLAMIVRNLLANAIKFTSAGGRIDLSAGRDPESPQNVRVVVRDTGRGIPPEDLDRVFDRLYQTREGDESSFTAGMGLGLHICRELVRLHGGRIWVESQVGVGSVFSFTLEAVGPHAREVRRSTAGGMGGGVAEEGPDRRG